MRSITNSARVLTSLRSLRAANTVASTCRSTKLRPELSL
jgi:hypothetical protein